MPKSTHRRPAGGEKKATPDGPAGVKTNGLRAFQHGDYDAAIASWRQLDATSQPAVTAALAEAYFRRALQARQTAQRLEDLQLGAALAPGDGRFWYHIGLAQHSEGRLAEASASYACAAQAGFSRRKALDLVRGLAEVERNPRIDLAQLSWLGAEERALLAPAAALLRGEPQVAFTATASIGASSFRSVAMAALWRGLALLTSHKPAAAQVELTLQAGQMLPHDAEVARLVYYGLALAAQGQPEQAFTFWNDAEKRVHAPRLQVAMLGLRLQRVRQAVSAGKWAEALALAEPALGLQDAALDAATPLLAVALTAHYHLAVEASLRAEWAEASTHWERMTELAARSPGLGPRAPLVHNLACTYEMEQKWAPAAEAWIELLRILPRREPKEKTGRAAGLAGTLSMAARRSWIRQRVLECYKKAGLPDQAIGYYRKVVKADPDNLPLRLEMAQALLANDQQIAARNELSRIIEMDERQLAAYPLLAELQQGRGELYAAEQTLRKALDVDPDYEPALYGLSDMLLERAHRQLMWGQYALARISAEEAILFRPNSFEAWATLGDIGLSQKKPDRDAARSAFENALKTGRPEAYLSVLQRWAAHDDIEESRAVIARAEAAGVASAHFYVDAARICFEHATSMAGPANMFLGPQRTSKRPTVERWRDLGGAMLKTADDKAGALALEVWRHIVLDIGRLDPAVGMAYAQKALERMPLDVELHLMLGVIQCLLPEHLTAGKQTLRKARQMARREGNARLVDEIDAVLREVDSVAMMYQEFGAPGLPGFFKGRFKAPHF